MADLLEAGIIQNLRACAGLPVRVDMAQPEEAQAGIDSDIPHLVPAGHDARWIRVWRNRPCLVVSRPLFRLPDFAQAAKASAAAGWPVAVRRSGGTTVVHRPGILNISLIHLQAQPMLGRTMRQDYLGLLDIIANALRPLGLVVGHGIVPGAHCDGDYNLCWRSRKLAGTAGLVTRLNGSNLRLFHASLAVSGDVAGDLTAISRFEAALGLKMQYCLDAHTTVEQALAAETIRHSRGSDISHSERDGRRAARRGERG